MNNYEIFTENFSQVIQANGMMSALAKFFLINPEDKPIAIVDCAYPEFLEHPNDKLRRDIHRLGQIK
jgi:hypothetical protein